MGKLFMNPWVLVGLLLALATAGAAGFRVGSRYEIAQQLEDKQLIAEAADAFDDRAARRIAQIKPIHQTIQGQIKETIREETVYRDCVTDPVTERLLDAARANHAAPSAPGGSVP